MLFFSAEWSHFGKQTACVPREDKQCFDDVEVALLWLGHVTGRLSGEQSFIQKWLTKESSPHKSCFFQVNIDNPSLKCFRSLGGLFPLWTWMTSADLMLKISASVSFQLTKFSPTWLNFLSTFRAEKEAGYTTQLLPDSSPVLCTGCAVLLTDGWWRVPMETLDSHINSVIVEGLILQCLTD